MTETTTTPAPAAPATTLRDALAAEAGVLERELTEIDMLVAQVRQEAARHEQKRAQAADKLAATSGAPKELADLHAQVVTLTHRAAVMEAQVEVLEGKRKALARFRDALVRHVESPEDGGALDADAEDDDGVPALPPAVSRMLLGAQEDLRREIARAMHDGPAQSLTNIVLQAQIVERLLARDPEQAAGEVRLLMSMVQQTLDATKSFIFDVRPMVLDDLGLMPTLRRATRERGRRAGITVDFESSGGDRRLAPETESGLFRILDEAMAGFLSTSPDTLALRLDWSDRVEATVTALRAGAELAGVSAEPDLPDDEDLPPTLAAMVQDRRGERRARADAARQAAIAALPRAAWREIQQRAGTIGATAELLDGGGTLRVSVAVPEPEPDPAVEPADG
jgi:two-component system sensor histidine kinase DegS